MDRPQWNSIGLCSGVGLLDIAVCLGAEHLGIECKPAVLCEWDAYAAATLLARMEDATLESCPIWCGDLRDFDAKPFRGVVDVLAAGLPCQPYSVAGKQEGLSDRRSYGDDGAGPIPQFLRIVFECRPTLAFLENVPPWVRDGYFQPVGEELSRMGYKIEDPLFITAESVGASHKRERVFVLAHNSVARSWRLPKTDRRNDPANIDRNGRRPLADSEMRKMRGAVQGMARVRQSVPFVQPRKRHKSVGNTSGARTQSLAAGSGPRDSIGESGLFAPGPGADWGSIPEYLWPATQSGVRVVVDGCELVVDACRADQLRCAGNAVVPLCASFAFVELVRGVLRL